MEETSTRQVIWNEAGKAGAALGLLCVAVMLLNILVGKIPTEGNIALSALTTFLNIVLWAVKFVGCILLMRFFMVRLVVAHPDYTGVETLRLGTASALLSALIVAAAFLCQALFITPDMFADSFAQVLAQAGPSMDANSRAVMEKMQDKMPVIGFFSQLIYCFLYGYILSAILSRRIPPRNPFETLPSSDE